MFIYKFVWKDRRIKFEKFIHATSILILQHNELMINDLMTVVIYLQTLCGSKSRMEYGSYDLIANGKKGNRTPLSPFFGA